MFDYLLGSLAVIFLIRSRLRLIGLVVNRAATFAILTRCSDQLVALPLALSQIMRTKVDLGFKAARLPKFSRLMTVSDKLKNQLKNQLEAYKNDQRKNNRKILP